MARHLDESAIVLPEIVTTSRSNYTDYIGKESVIPTKKQFKDYFHLDARRHLKDGGSIHINLANRGKFNATKARTGKTTEELTHSKNPLTRKRAIFAQNAAKWHH